MKNSYSYDDALDILRTHVDMDEIVDINSGLEKALGLTRMQMNYALTMLQKEGYEVYTVRRNGRKVVCRPGYGQDRALDYIQESYIL